MSDNLPQYSCGGHETGEEALVYRCVSVNDAEHAEAVRRACEEFAAIHGLGVGHDYSDIGREGADRPQLSRLLARVRTHHIAHVVIYDDAPPALAWVDWYVLARALSRDGITVHFVPLDISELLEGQVAA